MDEIYINSGLVIGYEDRKLCSLSQDIPLSPGGVSVLVGNNGVGKTTLLKTICGTLPPLSGTIPACQKVYLPEDLDFSPLLTPRRLIFSLFSKPDPYVEAAMLFGVPMETPYENMSKGNRQKLRVVIAEGFAWSTKASVLCLDEPFSGLDGISRQMFMDVWNGDRVRPRIFSNAHRIISMHSGPTPSSDQTIVLAGSKLHRLPPIHNCDHWMEFALSMGVSLNNTETL